LFFTYSIFSFLLSHFLLRLPWHTHNMTCRLGGGGSSKYRGFPAILSNLMALFISSQEFWD
jgi:hypothetical protein